MEEEKENFAEAIVEAGDALVFYDFIEALRKGLREAADGWDFGSRQRKLLADLVDVIDENK